MYAYSQRRTKTCSRRCRRGNFREDLFYRINVIPVFMPPLRERPNDIPLLANHFLSRMAAEQGKDLRELSADVMRKILDYSWPGNVRELENSIEHAVVLAKGNRIEAADLPAAIRNATIPSSSASVPLLAETERALLERVLVECKWNKKEGRAAPGYLPYYALFETEEISDRGSYLAIGSFALSCAACLNSEHANHLIIHVSSP